VSSLAGKATESLTEGATRRGLLGHRGWDGRPDRNLLVSATFTCAAWPIVTLTPEPAHPGLAGRGSVSEVADVSRERRVDDLHRLKAGIGDIVEEALAGAEQDGREIENELLDHPCPERLPHG